MEGKLWKVHARTQKDKPGIQESREKTRKILPWRGQSMIKKEDCQERPAPLHFGPSDYSIFSREAYTSWFEVEGARVRVAFTQSNSENCHVLELVLHWAVVKNFAGISLALINSLTWELLLTESIKYQSTGILLCSLLVIRFQALSHVPNMAFKSNSSVLLFKMWAFCGHTYTWILVYDKAGS